MKTPLKIVDDGPLPFVLLAIARLAEAIDRETQDLRRPVAADMRVHAQRKSQGLMELNRLAPSLVAMRAHPQLRAALADLVAKLDVNHRLLFAKLKAARAIADLLARAISEGQSDGTYSDQVWRENRR